MSELAGGWGNIISVTTTKIKPSIAVSFDDSFFDVCDSILIIATDTNSIIYRPIFGLEYSQGVLLNSGEHIEEYWTLYSSVSKKQLRELVEKREECDPYDKERLDACYEDALIELIEFGVKIVEE